MNQGRIIEEHKTRYTISTENGIFSAVVRGIFHRDTENQIKIFPKVGDYVEYTLIGDNEAVIERLLPRTSEVIRSVTPRDLEGARVTSEVIVANVTIILIIVGLDNDFNLSRIERYALLAKQSNINAVILLNKSDTVENSDTYIVQVKERLPHIPVFAISATTHVGMKNIHTYITPQTTAVLLGSSGAGKSTLTNWLLGEKKQRVGSVRKDDSRGKHTTTSRQLFTLPTGGYLIDTPGMRELGVLSTEEDEAETFLDIEDIALQCQFSNCDHEKTKGCAILEAILTGRLDQKHFNNYLKIKRERKYTEKKFGSNSGRKQKKQ